MLGKGIFGPQEETREFANAWIMPDDKQGFYRAGRLGKHVQQRFGVSVIKSVVKVAGRRLLRQLAKDHVERIARAQRRRGYGAIGKETRCPQINADTPCV